MFHVYQVTNKRTFVKIKQVDLDSNDTFIVDASDGVWEFLSNKDVAKIVLPYYLKNFPETAGNALVSAASQQWNQNDNVADDMTCIIIFLEVEWL